MADYVGQQYGNYRLTKKIGEGGFADVYLGQHMHLNRQAAIKILHDRLMSSDVEQFRNEARTIEQLKHPNIIQVLDFGVENSIPFLVMEYAPNGTLRQRHPRGRPIPQATTFLYVNQIAAALQYGHDQRLIHRDVKPENMLVAQDNKVLLSDFGIALVVQSTRFQSTKDAIGTPYYMAPEQLEGKPSRASDQYALAIVVYEWLTGAPPFKGTGREIALQHLSVQPPPFPENLQIPPAIQQTVMQGLTKDPQQRFPSIQRFAQALEQASQPQQQAQIEYISQPAFNAMQSPAVPGPQKAQAYSPPSLSPDLNTVYREGVRAREQGDLERTAVLWQQILDIDPNFGNGTLVTQMKKLEQELHPLRVQRLRQQAKQAHNSGDWSQEINCWQTLLGLEPRDAEAKERIPIAQNNQQYVWMYENAQQFINEADFPSAARLLREIWSAAPYYGDPAELAKSIGISAPKSNEEIKAEEQRQREIARRAKQAREEAERERVARQEEAERKRADDEYLLKRVYGSSSVLIWFCLLFLTGGVGSTVGILTQSWPWAVGAAAFLGLVVYPLSYRKGLSLFTALIAVIIGIALAYGVTWHMSTLNYAQSQVSHLGVGNRTLWLKSQIIYGIITGISTGFVTGLAVSLVDVDDAVSGVLGSAGFVLLISLIVAILAGYSDWGFGFGFGWDTALLTSVISILAVAAVIATFTFGVRLLGQGSRIVRSR